MQQGDTGETYVWNVAGLLDSYRPWRECREVAYLLGSVILQHSITKVILNSSMCQRDLNCRIGTNRSERAGNCSLEQTLMSGLMSKIAVRDNSVEWRVSRCDC